MEDRVGEVRRWCARAALDHAGGVEGHVGRRRRRRTPTRPPRGRRRSVVSSRLSRDVVVVDAAQVDPPRRRPRRRPRRPDPARETRHGVEELLGQRRETAGAAAPLASARAWAWMRRAIAAQARRAVVHGIHRRPSRRGAPGRCRCWRSPSRGGCAARGSAGRAGMPGRPRRRRRPRRGGRAATARGPARTLM